MHNSTRITLVACLAALIGCSPQHEVSEISSAWRPPFPPLPPAPAAPKAVLAPLAGGAACMLQSNFGNGVHGNFEVVVIQDHQLVHYWHDNSNANYAWHRGSVISTRATAITPGCLIQSDFGSTSHGNFELVVQEGTQLVHYFKDNSSATGPWTRAQVIANGVSGPGAIIQSDFKSGTHGNFEVVVPIGGDLVHFFHDNSDVSLPWTRAQTIAHRVSGPGTIVQSDFMTGAHGNFEVAVPVGGDLIHFFHDNSDVRLPWQQGQTIAHGVTGAAALITSDFKSGANRNFEVVVPVGTNLVHFFHDNSNAGLPWQQGQIVASGISGPGALIQSDFKTGANGNFEVAVTAERAFVQPNAFVAGNPTVDQHLVHFFHDNSDAGLPWRRAQNIAFRGRSEKVCQLTGTWDKERIAPTTTGALGIDSVDLGFPVDDGNKLTFLFGDAFPDLGHPGYLEDTPDDAIGVTMQAQPPTDGVCPAMTVNDIATTFGVTIRQTPVVTPSIRQGYFDVPSSGFATPEGLYAFFWTDHCAGANTNGNFCDPSHLNGAQQDPAANFIGRSVLARSSDGGRSFQQVGNVPKPFVYTASVNTDRMVGLPDEQRRGVLVFGVPCYRESTPYLASVPSAQADNVGAWQFYQGSFNGVPLWTSNPTVSQPIFDGASDELPDTPTCSWRDSSVKDAGCVGEFSVDWNPGLHKWVMLYGCGAQQGGHSALEEGVRVRIADAPWGPWSTPTTIFNPDNTFGDHGHCHFMHAGDEMNCDAVGGDKGNDWGGVYAPFLVSRWSQSAWLAPGGLQARLYWLMSTWNPYQVVVMKTDLFVPQ